MGSLISGYEYDIFISYRQKDNKHDGWVTEFVNQLKGELESTFKEDISVYFDINPHDGLLEIHDVNASLRNKLKCLIFIPIISKTYCDPKSFAWEHEFTAFVDHATKDKYGLKVRLPSGNVANRVLPVLIHDLTPDDIKLCESIVKVVLRGIEFIYREPGINRPLRPEDDREINTKTKYRNQINKLANTIEEIITGIEDTQRSGNLEQIKGIDEKVQLSAIGHQKYDINNAGRHKTLGLKNFLFTLLVLVPLIGIVFSWKGLKRIAGFEESQRDLAKTNVENAVKLINIEEFASAKKEIENALSKDPNYSYAWSTLAAIDVKQGNLNQAILETIKALKSDPENFEAAYNMAYALDEKKDYNQAVEWYTRAIEIDSSFIPAYSALGRTYNALNLPVNAILVLSEAKKKYPVTEYIYLINKNLGNAFLLQGMNDTAIKYLELSREINPYEPETIIFLATAYYADGQRARSIELLQKYIESESDTTKRSRVERYLKEILGRI